MKRWIRAAQVANNLLLVVAFFATVGTWCLIGLSLTGAIAPLKLHWSVLPASTLAGVGLFNIYLWVDDKLFAIESSHALSMKRRH